MDSNTAISKIPRRAFLRMLMGAAALGYAECGISAIRPLRPKKPRVTLNGPLSYSIFSALIGESFTLSLTDPKSTYQTRVQLMEANTISLTQKTDQFNVVFRVLDEELKPDGVYWIKHRTAGKTKLFLEPMSEVVTDNYCIAQFNLLLA